MIAYDASPYIAESELPALALIDAANWLRSDGQERLAGAIESIDTQFNELVRQLAGTREGRFEDLIVTDADGATIGHIGTFVSGSDQQISGGAFSRLWVAGNPDDPYDTAPFYVDNAGKLQIVLGDTDDAAALEVLDGAGNVVVWAGKNGSDYGLAAENIWVGPNADPLTAPFYAGSSGVRIGRGGYVEVVDADEAIVGFIGPDTDTTKAITSWGAHTTGERKIQIAAHGWESGNTVKVTGSGAGNGKWPVRRLDADWLILLGSTVANAGAGGSAQRYFAGVYGEALAAAGGNPYEAYLKATERGLFIKDAYIEIAGEDSLGNAVVTTISPEEIEISNAVENQYLQLSEGYLLASTITGNQTAVEVWPGLCRVKKFIGPHFTEGALEIVQSGPDYGARLSLGDNSGAFLIQLDGLTGFGYIGTLNLTNALDIAYGGTAGATDAEARTNLDVYSKAEVNALIPDMTNYYTKTEMDLFLGGKASSTHGHSITVANQNVPAVPNTHNHGASSGGPVG